MPGRCDIATVACLFVLQEGRLDHSGEERRVGSVFM